MESKIVNAPASPTSLVGVAIAASALVIATFACGSAAGNSTFADLPEGFGQDGGSSAAFPPERKGCEGLACRQVECGGAVSTTLTGTVTAPNGTLPLYNVIVYVPDAPLEPLRSGVACDRCGSVSGRPLVSTLTDVDGRFELRNMPVGRDIPLVIQIGKWRRKVTLPPVEKCVTNTITDRNLTRLPKNKAEGDIPRVAVTTGRCDQLACLLPKLGLDPSEFTPSSGDGRLHLYRGATTELHHDPAPVPAPAPTGTLSASTDLWASADKMKQYDMILLSCECGEHNEDKPAASKAALYDFASAGGRVFASHFHYTWASSGPLSSTADWEGSEGNRENPPGPFLVDRSFAKGDALARWLVNVRASDTLGEIPIAQPRENVGKVMSSAMRWAYSDSSILKVAPESTKYLSVNTPVGKPAAEQCGKFVFADMHLYGGDEQDPATALPDDDFPTSCSKDLTPEERALAFLFFDLSSCVQDDRQPPRPPIR